MAFYADGMTAELRVSILAKFEWKGFWIMNNVL